MRCRDVSRAIAAPNGAIPEADLRAHLASCPRCAGRADAARRLDRLWEATRPAPPSTASWDAAWARIDRELASPPPIASPSAPARPLVARRSIRLAAGVALVAAAVLLALNLPGPAPRVGLARGPVYGAIEVPVGHTVLYHVDTAEHRVVQVTDPVVDEDLTFQARSEAGLDDVDYFALFGWFEAMPSLTASASTGEGSSPFGPRPQ